MKNYGLQYEERKEEDYVLGGFTRAPKIVLESTGQWTDILPEFEHQFKRNIETMSCVSFGTLNALEMLHFKLWGEIINYCDRYLAIASETTETGNSPQKVAETLRNVSGCIEERYLPFDKTIKSFEEYHSPKPLPNSLLDKGKRWLKTRIFKHEWVNGDNSRDLMEALTYSPVGVSVTAWSIRDGLYYRPEGSRNNHWTLLVGYEEGKHWLVFDSYLAADGGILKRLEWNTVFDMAKRYFLKKEEINTWGTIIQNLKRWTAKIFK